MCPFVSSVQSSQLLLTAQFGVNTPESLNTPLNVGLMRSFLLEHSRAFPNTRSRQQSSRWYEFTRSSPIIRKLPSGRRGNTHTHSFIRINQKNPTFTGYEHVSIKSGTNYSYGTNKHQRSLFVCWYL